MSLETPSHEHSPGSAQASEPFARDFPPGWLNPMPRGVYHLLVVGAGPAGLVAARAAAALGARVALIERHRLGGDCLNYGCVPSKTMLRFARLYADMRCAANFGVAPPADIRVDFSAVMDRVRRVRERIGRGDSATRLIGEGIDLYFGTARFTGRDCVDVEGVRLRFRKALIATGSRSMLPQIPGLADAGFLTNEIVFDLAARLPDPGRGDQDGGGRLHPNAPVSGAGLAGSKVVEPIRGILEPSVNVRAAPWRRLLAHFHSHTPRRTIISLILPMARAGFRPFGQTSVQFRIVLQRNRRYGSCRSSSLSPVA